LDGEIQKKFLLNLIVSHGSRLLEEIIVRGAMRINQSHALNIDVIHLELRVSLSTMELKILFAIRLKMMENHL